MAGPAEGLEILQFPRLAAPLQRYNVVGLQASSPPAGLAPPTVAVQGGPPETTPPAPAQPVTVVVAAHSPPSISRTSSSVSQYGEIGPC